MSLFATVTLTDLLSPNGMAPALWSCPIQQGLPLLLNFAKDALLFFSVFFFLGGVNAAVFGYLLSYGSEEKIKAAHEKARGLFIGAAVVMLSSWLINFFAGSLLLKSPTVFDRSGNIVLNGSEKPQCNQVKTEKATPVEPSLVQPTAPEPTTQP